MNTYQWTCRSCETPNTKFVEPEDGKQVEFNCGNCGTPGDEVQEKHEQYAIERQDMLDKVSEMSTHASSMEVFPYQTWHNIETIARVGAPRNWRV